jgi:hypothetical protein
MSCEFWPKSTATNPLNPGGYILRGVTDAALQNAWELALADINTKRANGATGKFIINMWVLALFGSHGTGCHDLRSLDCRSYGFDDLNRQRLMQRVIDEAWQNDVIVVVPTGNDGADGGSLATITPQNYGTAANQLITVGGVADTGVFADRTTRDLGTGGSISVYALSESVVGASYQSNTGTMSQDGTSFAAPAVAGLAAYFGALPSLSSQFTAGNVAQQMKNYIIRYVSCYTRSEG